jgi:hypothetical protein
VGSYQLSGSLPTHVEVDLGCDNCDISDVRQYFHQSAVIWYPLGGAGGNFIHLFGKIYMKCVEEYNNDDNSGD